MLSILYILTYLKLTPFFYESKKSGLETWGRENSIMVHFGWAIVFVHSLCKSFPLFLHTSKAKLKLTTSCPSLPYTGQICIHIYKLVGGAQEAIWWKVVHWWRGVNVYLTAKCALRHHPCFWVWTRVAQRGE